jgi:hypothetical protein
MKSGAILAALLALGIAVPAGAQEAADKTRLDEFDLPQDGSDPGIEQLGNAAEVLPTSVAPSDRQLAVPGPPEVARAPVAQLSRPGEGGSAPQVSDRQESRDLASGSVSSSTDSRPQGATALAGYDRCDPQLEPERLARCRRVLELRAAEFNAAEAPKLSAEQALLAQRGDSAEQFAATSSRLRLRFASAEDPNAEMQSNQELASIYLKGPAPTAPAPPPQDADAASLAEVLSGLQIDVATPAK